MQYFARWQLLFRWIQPDQQAGAFWRNAFDVDTVLIQTLVEAKTVREQHALPTSVDVQFALSALPVAGSNRVASASRLSAAIRAANTNARLSCPFSWVMAVCALFAPQHDQRANQPDHQQYQRQQHQAEHQLVFIFAEHRGFTQREAQ